MAEMKEYTADEVSKHNKETDCWIIIGNEKNGGPKIYDVTKYLDDHPGGSEVMMEFAGKDADNMFEDIGHSKDARSTMQKWVIGKLKGGVPVASKQTKATKEKTAEIKSGGGLNPVVVLVVLLAIALGFYFSQQK